MKTALELKPKAASPLAIAPVRKAGRKASGLRDLKPEEARLAISRATLEAVELSTPERPVSVDDRLPGAVRAVKGVVAFRDDVSRRTGRGDAPTLERLLRGDVEFARIAVPDDGVVTMQTVVRGDGGVQRLRQAGVPKDLVFVAEGFLADVERARIGKLTASYGSGRGGGVSAEPERVLVAMQRLIRAQSGLNNVDRIVVWGALVHGLSLLDVGWATDGDRLACKVRLTERGALRLEIALERMKAHYLAMGR